MRRAEAPERREAQRALAREVTALVHGDDQVARAERAAAVLFGERHRQRRRRGRADGVRGRAVDRAGAAADGMPLVDLLATVKLAASKSEAMRLLKSGGVYVNNVRATDERTRLTGRGCDRRRGVRAAQRTQGSAHRQVRRRLMRRQTVSRQALTHALTGDLPYI